MQNKRKQNYMKERIRKEKERQEKMQAEEERLYIEGLEQEANSVEETVENQKMQEQVITNHSVNPALQWIEAIKQQSENSKEINHQVITDHQKMEEEAAREREMEARRKAEEAAKERQRELAKQQEEEAARERQRELAQLQEEKVIIQSKAQLNNIQSEKGDSAKSRSRHNDTNTKSISIKVPKIKYILIGVASIIVIVFAGFVFSTMKNSKAATTANSSNVEMNSNLVKGLRLSAVQKYQDAALKFEKVDYKTLGKDDKKAVLFTYLLAGKAQEAIDLEPDFAESVVSYYIAIDNLKKVKELKTKNQLINFEIAAIDNKHEEVIKLKEKVPLDGRREGIIVNSYLKLNQSEEAKKFAQKVGNKDLLEKIDNNNTPNNSATSIAKINAN
ncbi:hypothetical protein [Bacillus pseudomycoides]|uniref:hypothetical protein n=1 Tax=Bacillus pseudomycoides TaxID=64104 RepID=UPI001FB4B9B3|nr:hypothetical protein [Bacillus pseudomycoides]